MNGYVVGVEHFDAALDGSDEATAARLAPIRELLTDLGRLEETFPDRLREEREAEGIPSPRLSRAARDEVDGAHDEARRHWSLLLRRCRRAPTLGAGLRELLETAEVDLEMADFLTEGLDHTADAPARRLTRELRARKQEFVQSLREAIGEADLSDDGSTRAEK